MRQGKELFIFERYMIFRKSGGNHCQLNVVPVSTSAAVTATTTIDAAAKEQAVPLQRVDGPSKVPTDMCLQSQCTCTSVILQAAITNIDRLIITVILSTHLQACRATAFQL